MSEPSAARGIREMIEADARVYVRKRDLPKVLDALPDDIEDYSVEGTELIVKLLKARCHAHAALGRRRHWSYDMNRHIALLAALKSEEAALAHLRNAHGLAQVLRAAE